MAGIEISRMSRLPSLSSATLVVARCFVGVLRIHRPDSSHRCHRSTVGLTQTLGYLLTRHSTCLLASRERLPSGSRQTEHGEWLSGFARLGSWTVALGLCGRCFLTGCSAFPISAKYGVSEFQRMRNDETLNHVLQRTGGAVSGRNIFGVLKRLRGSRRSLSFRRSAARARRPYRHLSFSDLRRHRRPVWSHLHRGGIANA